MSFESSRTTGNGWPQDSNAGNKDDQNAQSRVDALKGDVGNAIERGRSGIAESAHAAGDSLTTEVAKLRTDMAAIQQTLSKFASRAGGEAVKAAQDVGSAVASQIGDVAGEMVSATKEQAKTFASELENMARRNPLGTIGATLLVGVIIGMITRGSKA
jgi:ElaB/YqjD/DUF883 family membrane-anchored ribosome-binding protein